MLMRMTELKGRVVVDPTTARKRGVVVDVLVDATTARLAAVDVSAPEADGAERISADWIARIGRDAVMLARTSVPEEGEPPGATEDCLDYASLVGLEVLDEGGDRVGYLEDAQVDPDSLSVTAYQLTGAAWRRWLRWSSEIGSDEVTSWSRELMLVRARRPTEQVVPGVLRRPEDAEPAAVDDNRAEQMERWEEPEQREPAAADATTAEQRRPAPANETTADQRQPAAPEDARADGAQPEAAADEPDADSLHRKAGRR